MPGSLRVLQDKTLVVFLNLFVQHFNPEVCICVSSLYLFLYISNSLSPLPSLPPSLPPSF
jgi:hypothetical protein